MTVNWKLTRPGLVVRVECGEPFGLVVPYDKRLAGSLSPECKLVEADPELAAFMQEHSARRRERLEQEEDFLKQSEPQRPLWDTSYVRGVMGSWPHARVPEVKLRLREFAEAPDDGAPAARAQSGACPFGGDHPPGAD